MEKVSGAPERGRPMGASPRYVVDISHVVDNCPQYVKDIVAGPGDRVLADPPSGKVGIVRLIRTLLSLTRSWAQGGVGHWPTWAQVRAHVLLRGYDRPVHSYPLEGVQKPTNHLQLEGVGLFFCWGDHNDSVVLPDGRFFERY